MSITKSHQYNIEHVLALKDIRGNLFYTDFIFLAESSFKLKDFKSSQEYYDKAKKSSVLKSEYLHACLGALSLDFSLNQHVSTAQKYISALNDMKWMSDKLFEISRLRFLIKVLKYYRKDDWMISTYKQLIDISSWPMDKMMYSLDLIHVDKPVSALKVINEIDIENVQNTQFFYETKAKCFEAVSDFESAKELYRKLVLEGSKKTSVVNKLSQMEVLTGSELKTFSLSYVNEKIMRGESAILDELLEYISVSKDFSYQLAYMRALAIFEGIDVALDYAREYIRNTEDLVEIAHIKMLFISSFNREFLVSHSVPSFIGFYALANIYFSTKDKLMDWVFGCGGCENEILNKVIKITLNNDRYLGGDDAAVLNGRDFLFHKNENSKKLLIMFCGIHGDLFLKTNVISPFLLNSDVSVLWLHDQSGKNYAQGTPSFGDSPLMMARGLSSFVAENDFDTVYCLGTSGAAGAASFFGKALQAKKVFAFSPVTYIDLSKSNKAGLAKEFMSYFKSSFDLRSIYINNKTTELNIYFGDQNKVDSHYAMRMQGLDNVYLHPVVGSYEHGIIDKVILSGEFERIVRCL